MAGSPEFPAKEAGAIGYIFSILPNQRRISTGGRDSMRLIFLTIMFAVAAFATPQDEDRTGRLLKDIQRHINRAGQDYKAEKYQASANQINAAFGKMKRCFDENAAEYKDDLIKEYNRIGKAHELLAAQGIKMKELVPFPEDFGSADAQQRIDEMKSKQSDESSDDSETDDGKVVDEAAAVSFKTTIAPILTRQCGNCHIRRDRGEYSMASYEKMMRGGPSGDSIVAGKPDESVLFELVESDEMPPPEVGNLSDKEKAVIKRWIEEGAKFDGDDPTASFGNARGNRRGRRGR